MKLSPTFQALRFGLPLSMVFLNGCGRAPSFDILGSFFPAWLICIAVAMALTALSLRVLNRYVEIAWPVAVYPGLTACFTFALWLALFR